MDKEFEEILKKLAASRKRTQAEFRTAMERMISEMAKQQKKTDDLEEEVKEEQDRGARLTKHRISL